MKVHPDIVCRRLGEAAVLVDLTTSQVFELNATGYRVWQLLGEGLDVDAIRDRLLGEFDVERARLDREMSDLLEALERQGLIVEG